MKALGLAMVTGALLAAGCEPGGEHGPANRWLVRSYGDDGINNAIVTQRTLYPYHFVTGTCELTPLGRHDLSVLARHLKRYPGWINLQGGQPGEELYDARVAAVREALCREHIDAAAVAIGPGDPGGAGMPSVRARTILARPIRMTGPGDGSMRPGGDTGGADTP